MTTKEAILKDIVNDFDARAEGILNDSEELIIMAGVVGFHDTQMFMTGTSSHDYAAGLMLTMVAGLGEQTKLLNKAECETLKAMADKFRVRND